MLPIIDGSTKNSFTIATEGGKKKYDMQYSFHVDTGDLAQKAGVQIREAAEEGYTKVSRFMRRKYRAMKVKRALNTMRKSLTRKLKLDLPIDFKALKSKVGHAIHA